MATRERSLTGAVGWRVWLAVLAWVFVAVALTQALLHGFLMGVSMSMYHLVAGAVQAVLILVPAVLYVLWRGTARRERLALEELRRSEQIREDLTAMLVHDLKNPAITAGMALDLLLEETEDSSCLPASDRETMVRARRNLRRLEGMIGDALAISAAHAGRMAVRTEPVDLCELVAEVVDDLAAQATAHGMNLARADGCPTAIAEVDREHIRRVLENLIANAVAHTSSGGTVDVAVTVGAGEAVVSVTDTGDGIDEQASEELFERYTRGANSQGRDRSSVGLGLAYCKLAVETHGGRIWAENVDGGGSRFSFSLPLAALG